jgi:hypothetical protein
MVSSRLFPLLFLLSLSSLSLSQNRQKTPVVPETCSVTRPANQPFVPPSPYPAKTIHGEFWFGTDRLWTDLPVTGTWRLGHYTPGDPTFRQKLIFWRQGYDPHAEPRPNLTVRGRRLDSPAPPLHTDGKGIGSWTKDDQFIMTGINLPTAGCWEITGRYENEELTFVLWVSP